MNSNLYYFGYLILICVHQENLKICTPHMYIHGNATSSKQTTLPLLLTSLFQANVTCAMSIRIVMWLSLMTCHVQVLKWHSELMLIRKIRRTRQHTYRIPLDSPCEYKLKLSDQNNINWSSMFKIKNDYTTLPTHDINLSFIWHLNLNGIIKFFWSALYLILIFSYCVELLHVCLAITIIFLIIALFYYFWGCSCFSRLRKWDLPLLRKENRLLSRLWK